MKDLPLAEITLRRYPKPFNLSGRDLVKKTCLSLGLLQLGDGRDTIVDVVLALTKGPVSTKHLESIMHRKQGSRPSNLRRQLKRLKDLGLIEKVQGNYRFANGLSLAELFEEKIKLRTDNILERVKEYCEACTNRSKIQ